MRIENTQVRIFAGDSFARNMYGVNDKAGKQSLWQTNASTQTDRVEEKRKEAQKKAMKIVSDVFEAEKSVDNDLDSRRQRIAAAEMEIDAAKTELKEYEKQKEELKQLYGIEEDSQEQQDLLLLEKRRDSMMVNSDVELTKEDLEQLARIDKEGMTDYQKRSLEIDGYGEPFRDAMKEAEKVIAEEQVIIREIGLERLKSAPMTEAVQTAGEIMESVKKEVIGMILEEGKETVDEKIAETEEALDEEKEETEKLEEHIEEIQRKSDEIEEATAERRQESKKKDEILELPVDYLVELDEVKTEVKQEVNNMLSEMKMLVEDIKGSVVDTEL